MLAFFTDFMNGHDRGGTIASVNRYILRSPLRRMILSSHYFWQDPFRPDLQKAQRGDVEIEHTLLKPLSSSFTRQPTAYLLIIAIPDSK